MLDENKTFDVKFVCGHDGCDGTEIEEVVTEVVQSSPVLQVMSAHGGVYLEYGDISTEGGELSRYQCSKCGHGVANDEIELGKFLAEKGFIKEAPDIMDSLTSREDHNGS